MAAWLFSISIFAVSMFWTPGPNNAMLASSGATYGVQRSCPHILGVSIGFPTMVVVVALGAATFIEKNPWLQSLLKWVGIVYLLWLAWKIAFTKPVVKQSASQGPVAQGRPLTFVQAALFQWINPKGWIIAITTVVTYTTPKTLLLDAALIAPLFVVIGLFSSSFWTFVGAGAARFLSTEQGLRWFNLSMAACLVVSLIPILREA